MIELITVDDPTVKVPGVSTEVDKERTGSPPPSPLVTSTCPVVPVRILFATTPVVVVLDINPLTKAPNACSALKSELAVLCYICGITWG